MKTNEVFQKKKKREKAKRKRELKAVTLCLETRTQSEGYMAKALKARCPKPSLVGSHRLCVRYTGGWVEFSMLWELNSRNHSKSGVKPEELVVGRPF